MIPWGVASPTAISASSGRRVGLSRLTVTKTMDSRSPLTTPGVRCTRKGRDRRWYRQAPLVERVHRDRRFPPPTDVGGGNRRLIYRDTKYIENGAEREARAGKHVGDLGSSSSNVGFPDPWLVIYPPIFPRSLTAPRPTRRRVSRVLESRKEMR